MQRHILTLAVSATALALASVAYADDNRATSGQSGTANSFSADQSGSLNIIGGTDGSFLQLGNSNSASITQSGTGNEHGLNLRAVFGTEAIGYSPNNGQQVGTGNVLNLSTTGDRNGTTGTRNSSGAIYQQGTSNETYLNITGSDNGYVISQYKFYRDRGAGNGPSSRDSTDNYAAITINGSSTDLRILQDGDRNTFVGNINGSNNTVWNSVIGEDNVMIANQNSNGNNIAAYQYYTGNRASVTQGGPGGFAGNDAQLIQYGNANEVSAIQYGTNGLLSYQYGAGNTLYSNQDGINTITNRQGNSDAFGGMAQLNTASITQFGFGNSVDATQIGNGQDRNNAYINQNGSMLRVTYRQNDGGNNFNLMQTGSNNRVNSTQGSTTTPTGEAGILGSGYNNASIVQGGSNNEVVGSQNNVANSGMYNNAYVNQGGSNNVAIYTQRNGGGNSVSIAQR